MWKINNKKIVCLRKRKWICGWLVNQNKNRIQNVSQRIWIPYVETKTYTHTYSQGWLKSNLFVAVHFTTFYYYDIQLYIMIIYQNNMSVSFQIYVRDIKQNNDMSLSSSSLSKVLHTLYLFERQQRRHFLCHSRYYFGSVINNSYIL